MKLKKLFHNIKDMTIKGSKDVEITGICSNSKLVAPGNLFFAKKDQQYISEAISSGAIAIVTDIYNPFITNVTQVICSNVAEIECIIAQRYYDNPSEKLTMVGITGTNGKTTCAYLIKHLFDAVTRTCGLIGTIEYIIGNNHYNGTHTTPEIIRSQKMLRDMISHNCKTAVMEVSSHGIKQKRIEGINYDAAIFTNLSLDHLDYHNTMDDYCQTKAKLFSALKPSGTAIINIDDPRHKDILANSKHKKLITYAVNNPQANLTVTNIQLSKKQTSFTLCFQEQQVPVTWSLIGRFNIYNFLAATATGISQGIEVSEICQILSSFKSVPGRLEKVNNDLHLNIYVDYAHTDDALEKVLTCLNEIKTKRIITVFGCGGDRDRSKRPKMAQVAGRLSDIVIVTTDNPRSENPETICQEITTGFSKDDTYKVVIDRYNAITTAITEAQQEDIILIAGKGHETYQILAHQTIEFDDRKAASEVCNNIHNNMVVPL